MPSLRLATDADARRWRDEQAAFFQGAGVAFRRPTLKRLRSRFKQASTIAVVHTDGICELTLDRTSQEIRVELLLPQGQSRRLLAPILFEAFREAARRIPDALDWRVWAVFMAGKDAQGQPDGGRGECEAWAQLFDADVYEDGGGWRIESTLRRLLKGYRRVALN